MDQLPEHNELCRLGLDPTRVTSVAPIVEKHGHGLYRIEHNGRSYVLKYFPAGEAHESCCYALLERYSVPTLPVHGRTERALLLEDLAASATWRAAEEADVTRPETGVAVAAWYRALHAAGRAILAGPQGAPEFLKRESDVLDAATILDTGSRLGCADNPVWALAAGCIEALQEAARSLPETLNYNDFHWSNLALSRERQAPYRAIVYDYHLLGIGLAYSDCRNVVGSLGEYAAAAFWGAYGPFDEREALLDAPLSTLYNLYCAARRPHFPAWAYGCLHRVLSGELAEDLQRALAAL